MGESASSATLTLVFGLITIGSIITVIDILIIAKQKLFVKGKLAYYSNSKIFNRKY